MIEKLERLKHILSEMESVVVAYSGGVDSALLLKVAYDCLGGEHVIGVTAVSASLAGHERTEAEALAARIGARYVLLESHETSDPRYLANMPDRCYFCKSEVYSHLIEYARREGYRYVLDGTNLDDLNDHRPGRQAAQELGVRSPLQEVGLTKGEIRELARDLGLPNWDKPAAPCLSSRIPYGTAITLQTLSQIGQAELVLRQMGLRQLRVRHHNDVARLEVGLNEFETVLRQREQIVEKLKQLGYSYITLDLSGFRSGSLNEVMRANGHR